PAVTAGSGSRPGISVATAPSCGGRSLYTTVEPSTQRWISPACAGAARPTSTTSTTTFFMPPPPILVPAEDRPGIGRRRPRPRPRALDVREEMGRRFAAVRPAAGACEAESELGLRAIALEVAPCVKRARERESPAEIVREELDGSRQRAPRVFPALGLEQE